MTLVLIRPRGWPESVFSVAGALLALACGLIHLHDVREVLLLAHAPLLFLLGLLLFSNVVAQSGFFDWAAALAIRSAKGNGKRLFRNVFVFATIVTVTLSLDTTALLVTPLVIACVQRAKLPPAPYVIACAFVANAGSLLLPISNLTNLLFAPQLAAHPPAADAAFFALHMAAPAAVALLATYAGLRWYYRAELHDFDPSVVTTPPLQDLPFFRAARVAVFATLFACVLADRIHVPSWLVPWLASVLLAAYGAARGALSRASLRTVPWGVVPFAIGLFLVVRGLSNSGLSSRIIAWHAELTPGWPSLLALGLGSAFASNLANNLPAALLMHGVLAGSRADVPSVMAVLVGLDLGPNVLAHASLATMLVLQIARERSIPVTRRHVLAAALRVTPAALALTLLAVGLVARALH